MSFGCMPGFQSFDCSIIWLIWVAIFFVSAMLRKAINEQAGIPFSLIGSTLGGIIIMVVFLYIPFIGGIKISVLGGIIGIFSGGLLGPMLGLPDTESTS